MIKRIFVKLTSSKFIVTLWAILLCSFIVITNKIEFEGIAYMCCATVLSYIIGNIVQKKIEGVK